MTAAQAMQDNYAKLMTDKGTADLPHPVMSMADFKEFIGFQEIEEKQLQFMLTDLKSERA